MSDGRVLVHLAVVEATQLSRLVADFRDLAEERAGLSDPALDRLAPPAYPDDVEADGEFRARTRDDLLDRRAEEAAVVVHALTQGLSADPTSAAEDPFADIVVEIPEDQIDAWLRTLTSVRLVVADRLGITDDTPDAGDERQQIYHWLGYRLELLVQAADGLD